MKVTRKEGGKARHILTGMIVSKAVVGQIAHRWQKEGLFASRWENIIGGWCVDYYNRYKKSPRKHLENIYQAWAEEHKDKTDIKLVGQLLDSLSGQYVREAKAINPDYLVDQAADHFNKISIENLNARVKGYLELGQTKKAQALLDKHKPVEIGQGVGIKVFSDYDALHKAFTDKKRPIVIHPVKALAEFLDDSFERDTFIAIEAPEKRGKSYWLQEFAWQAILQKRRVAMFQCGDLSQSQMLRRLYVRAAERPWKPATLQIPKQIVITKKGPEVTFKEKTWKDYLTEKEGRMALKRIIRDLNVNYEPLMLATYPNSTVNIDGIESALDQWERVYNWVPDMVVIDYMDILAPQQGSGESRDQINQTWKAGRRLSQRRRCLVLTASQSPGRSYGKESLEQDDYSEDKRKRSHTSGTISINQTPDEKRKGVYRLGWLFRREEAYDVDTKVYTAGNLGIGSPAMLGTW